MKITNLQRITKVLEYYYKRGHNSERANNLYHKILKNGEKS